MNQESTKQFLYGWYSTTAEKSCGYSLCMNTDDEKIQVTIITHKPGNPYKGGIFEDEAEFRGVIKQYLSHYGSNERR